MISTINVEDMHCGACALKIRRALADMQGIQAAHVNPARRVLYVDHTSDADPREMLGRIESAGFTPTLSGVDEHNARQRTLLKRLGVAGLAMMQVMMVSIALYAGAFGGMDEAYQRLLRLTGLIFCIPVVSYSAMPFFTNAIRSLRSPGSGISMDVPVALAITIAFSVSLVNTLGGSGEVYFDSVVMFTFLLLGARYIDDRLQRRFDVSGALLAALPRTAILLDDDKRRSVPITCLEPGDELWINEGEQIPVDGNLLAGAAELDEALLTGEADVVAKSAGSRLYAGTVNRAAGFAMKASAAVDESRIADIARLADQAELSNADVSRLTDRIAAVFIPAVLGLAAVTFIGWQLVDPGVALVATLTVLVVSCPCALSLATPAALTAAMTRLRQRGIVLTSSRALERAASISQVLVDKTGTLTTREPTIADVEVLGEGYRREAVLALAAALQRHSSHPYAAAFRHQPAHPDVSAVSVVTGQGVRGRFAGRELRIGAPRFASGGNPGTDAGRSVWLSLDRQPLARFELTDQIRADALEAVTGLRERDIEPVIVSGDSASRCAPVAARLGVSYLAGQSPESKLAVLARERAAGSRVLMVGDGINDVPVLAGADVSAAVVEASDLVKSRADVLLLSRRLTPLVDLIDTARSTRRIIRQNLGWALAYNLIAIPTAALGYMPPWVAALGMAASSTLVMLNASRLLTRSA